MSGVKNRPWSPPGHGNWAAPGRGIDEYLAHSSHGWATPGRDQPAWDEEQEATFRRHRANLRAAYEPEYDDAAYHYSINGRNRREASDVSVEALDLADYAQTLRRAEAARNDVYPSFTNTRPFLREPWSSTASPPAQPANLPRRVWSPPSLPFPPTASISVDRPFSALSRDTMMAPPSLVSAGSTSHSSHTNTGSLHQPIRRPFSLPADYIAPRGPAIFNVGSPSSSERAVGAGRRVPIDTMEMDYGIPNPDVSSFPPWARKWYAQEDAVAKVGTKGKRELPRSPVEDDIFGPYIHPAASQQDLSLLPWSAGQHNDEQALPGSIPENVKEERIRMLEREFGDKGTRKGWKQAEDADPMIGGVDEKGNLVTGGRWKRITVRVLQGIFVVLTAASGIYGALFIKLKTPAPPSGHAAAFILYGLSIITIFLLFFFFVISPLCLGRNKGPDSDRPNPTGMMVLPVNTPNQTGKKKNKKSGKGGQDGGSVQVNLIVDPNMFGTGTERGRGMPGRYEEDEYDEDYSDDDTTNPSSRRKGRRRRRDWRDDEEHSPTPRRRSIFAGLAMERAWNRARSNLKKCVALDVVLTVAWTACFVMILLGNRCPPGMLDGWCDAYNIATAGASAMIVLFATSAFFGIKDLHRSKVSPRTRT